MSISRGELGGGRQGRSALHPRVTPVPGAGRRVHISQSTMDCLKGEFEVEPGEGGSRCEYLKEKGIVTYLVVVPKQPLRNGINGVVSGGGGARVGGGRHPTATHHLHLAEAVADFIPRWLSAVGQHQRAQRQPQPGLCQP